MMLAQFLITMTSVLTTASTQCKCWNCCEYFCGKVLIWLMFLLTVCCAINPNNTTDMKDLCRTITPREAYFLEGEDIALTCNTPNIAAENLTFLRGKNSDEVPQEFIYKLNDTAIKLIIPNVTSADIDSSKTSTPYKCVNKHTYDCYDELHLRLEYYPREPVGVDCRIYDFNEMTCTWSLGVDYHGPEDISVKCEYAKFLFKSDNPNASWASCPNQTETACYWNSSTYTAAYRIDTKVSITATERNITKAIKKTFYQDDIMEPGPVKDLKVSRAAGNRCVELNWLPPKKYYSFTFIVSYRSTCTPEKMKRVSYYDENTSFNESRELCDLTPYTEYTYAVKGRLIVKKEEANRTHIEKGYWSATKELTQRTDNDVLDVNPALVSGLYEISGVTRPGLPGYHSLQLYWTPLTDCDLHDNADHVRYKVTAHNMTSTVKHPELMAQINVPKSRILKVTLQAINSIGPAPSSTFLTVFPANSGPSPSELILQYNKTEEHCATMADIMVRETQTNYSNIYHTLVWCEGTQLVCREPIKWKELGANITSFVLPGNLCDDDYRYGLVTHGYHKGQGQIVDTGIQWESCIYQLGKVADKPLENVHITDVQPSNGFSIEWNQYNCDQMKAYITHYMVTYCVGHGSDSCQCSEEKVNVNVSRLNSGYTASDLSPGSQVCIWVRGISKAGRGPANNKPLTHTISNFANFERMNMVPIIVIISIFVLILVGTGLIICSCKKYKQWKHETGQITIPSETEPLDIEMPDVNVPDGTLPGYYSPEKLNDDTERRYSIGDITEALEGDYIEPTSIDSYMLADENTVQINIGNSASAENADSNIPESVSENQPLLDESEVVGKPDSNVAVCVSENQALLDKSEGIRNIDSNIAICVSESQPLLDKSEDDENTELKIHEHIPENKLHIDQSKNIENDGLNHPGEQLTVKDGAIYVGRPDKEDPGHCRYSISSLLSDAHTEQTNCSMDDLLWDQSLGIADQGLDLEAILSPMGHDNFLDNEVESKKSKTGEPAGESLESTDDMETVPMEQLGLNPCSKADDTDISESNNIKIGNNEQWNSDFDELSDNYRQVIDLDSGDANAVKGTFEKELEDNAKECMEDDADSAIVDGPKMKNQISSMNGNPNEELNGINGNVERIQDSLTDQVEERNVEDEDTVKVHFPENTIEEDEQHNISKKNLSSNSNGLISGDSGNSSSKLSTSDSPLHSSDNSGPLQTYMIVDHDTLKEPCTDSRDVNSGNTQSRKNKPEIINGNICREQLHNGLDQ